MLYLYTLMTEAWDLDHDTHQYLRKYILGFDLRQGPLSREMKEFYKNARSPDSAPRRQLLLPQRNFWNKEEIEKTKYNPLRHGLQYKINIQKIKDPPKKIKKRKITYYPDYIVEIDNFHRVCPNPRGGQYW